ncbi:hypothetical protein ACFORL_10100 [Legionella dresdenensis]|uniref:Ankyrin repeats (3 copies) n=1 Tax=Legionella dresdenensis TaxID=450200 RepID=A0ABV8CGS7_9GAMM
MKLIEAIQTNNFTTAMLLINKNEELTPECIESAYKTGNIIIIRDIFLHAEQINMSEEVLNKLIDISLEAQEGLDGPASAAFSLAIGLHTRPSDAVLSYAIQKNYEVIMANLDRFKILPLHIEAAINAANCMILAPLLENYFKSNEPDSLSKELIKRAFDCGQAQNDFRIEDILIKCKVPVHANEELVKEAFIAEGDGEHLAFHGFKIINYHMNNNPDSNMLDQCISYGNHLRLKQLLERGVNITPASLALAIKRQDLRILGCLTEHFKDKVDELVKQSDVKSVFEAFRKLPAESVTLIKKQLEQMTPVEQEARGEQIEQLAQIEQVVQQEQAAPLDQATSGTQSQTASILTQIYAKAQNYHTATKSLRFFNQAIRIQEEKEPSKRLDSEVPPLPVIPYEIAERIAFNFFESNLYRPAEIKSLISDHYSKPAPSKPGTF